jgi:energy-converting hydrogenase Eha subunit A
MKFGMEVMAIQGDLAAIIFNPIASIILKLLRFKGVR